MVFAMACVMLELKSIKNCSSSAAVETLFDDLPLLSSDLITFNWDCIFSWTLYKHLLNPAAWLQMIEASCADFSHLLRLSCEIWHEVGGVEAMPAALAMRL